MTSEKTPHEAKARLHAGGEIAFLDVREAGQFGEGHPLFAVPCQYSRLELIVAGLVPRRGAPVLLIDAGDGVGGKAARRLLGLGYTDVSIVAGGAPGWEAAGLTLFKGVNVPSKTLGEMAEAIWHPATIDAGTLRDWRGENRVFAFFDARPPVEFAKMHVPGAVCLPNGELAHRFAATMRDEETPVLISCAGRTRGIVGAIGLKLAGVPNPVFALENGTQGWALAGEELERGDDAGPYPALGDVELEESRRRAEAIRERWGIPEIDFAGMEKLRAQADRTTYVFDVRSADEFTAGHLLGAVHAPGGQLVQATDQWIGVRHARVVLADDTGLRAALAAFWLRQLGWEAFVLAGDAPPVPPPFTGEGDHAQHGGGGNHRPQHLPSPPPPAQPVLGPAGGRTRGPVPLPRCAGEEPAADSHILLDLRSSQAHRRGHPRGALWTVRPRLAATPSPALPHKGGGSAQAIVVIADEPAVAELAAIDLRELGYSDIRLLEGGMAAWETVGLPTEATPDIPSPAEAIDFLHFVHDRHDGNLDASRRYLEWEQGLVAQLDEAERAEFRVAGPRPDPDMASSSGGA